MGDLVEMPIGPPIEMPDKPTAQDFARLREVRRALEAQVKAGTPRADPGLDTRTKVQIAAAVPGAIGGLMTQGPTGLVTGGMGGYGLGGVGYDLATGSPRSNRDLLQAAATAGSQFIPGVSALPFASRMLVGGLTSGLTGAGYDLVTGQSAPTAKEQLTRGAGDVFAGTFGAAGSEHATDRSLARGAEVGVSRKQSLRPFADRESLMQWGEREGVPLSGADVSKSRTTAAFEQFPKSQLLGARTVDDFRTRQMTSLDDAVNRHLGRLEARGASGNPTESGTEIANQVERIKRQFDHSANQAYSHERQMLGENRNFQPTNFQRVAQEIVDEEGRSPYPPAAAATRTAAPGRHTEVVQPGLVIYDAAGNPITLPAITQMRDLDWAQGRRYLALMGEKAYGGGQMPGKVSNASLERLHAALAQDMNEHAARQGPEFVDFRNSVDQMYGQAKDAVRDRLQPLLQAAEKGGPEAAYAGMFKPGARGHTVALREFPPRETFDRAAGTWLDQQVQKSTSASVGDRVLHSPAQLRAKLKPFIDSGQVDEMFSPEEAQWVRDYYRHSPALATAEKLAGNPSGTGQAVETSRTIRDVVTNPVTLGATGGGAVGGALGGGPGVVKGSAAGAALGGLLSTAVPEVVANTMFSEPGRRFFAYQGRPNPESITRAFYNTLAAQGATPKPTPEEEQRRQSMPRR
jgi:hypothetical protein